MNYRTLASFASMCRIEFPGFSEILFTPLTPCESCICISRPPGLKASVCFHPCGSWLHVHLNFLMSDSPSTEKWGICHTHFYHVWRQKALAGVRTGHAQRRGRKADTFLFSPRCTCLFLQNGWEAVVERTNKECLREKFKLFSGSYINCQMRHIQFQSWKGVGGEISDVVWHADKHFIPILMPLLAALGCPN